MTTFFKKIIKPKRIQVKTVTNGCSFYCIYNKNVCNIKIQCFSKHIELRVVIVSLNFILPINYSKCVDVKQSKSERSLMYFIIN